MALETAPWFARFIPLLIVVAGGLLVYALARHRKRVPYPPGRWFRLFDKDGNEIKGSLRTVMAVVLIVGALGVLAAVILPFIAP